MKTKAEILGRLLKEKAIDEEELVILMMNEIPTQYIPYPVYPYPQWPNYPYYPVSPIIYKIPPSTC